jgi:YidC/Oxa1 family membrane protein insertase
MFIQMPIWIALYGALGAAIQLRHAPLVPASWLPEGSLFLQDLSTPDALVHWQTPFFMPGMDMPIIGTYVISAIQGMLTGSAHVGMTTFNLLPILVGASMYFQQKMTPQPAATTPQVQQQRKMMNVMMIFFALMFYGLPSGLCLYISASSFLGFFEQRYLKKRMAVAQATVAAPQAGGGEPPTAPPRPAPEQSLVSGRDKSPAERLEAWIRRYIAPAEDKPDQRRGKGKKGR